MTEYERLHVRVGNSHAPRFMEAINDLEAAIAKAEGKL